MASLNDSGNTVTPVDLRVDLHRRLKAYAALNGLTIKAAAADLMELALNKMEAGR